MAFFTIMPTRPCTPTMAMNVKGWRKSSKAGVMPQKTKGKHRRMRMAFFQLLNSKSKVISTMKRVMGTYFISPPMASSCISLSPIHLRW